MEIYDVRSFSYKDENRDRMMLADSIRDAAPETEDCADCLLHSTGMCPGRLRDG